MKNKNGYAPGLERQGANKYPDHDRKDKVTAAIDRNGAPEYLSYNEKTDGGRNNRTKFAHPGNIGLQRAGENRVFNLPHPGTRTRKHPQRPVQARIDKEWNGSPAQLANFNSRDGVKR
jgi:hypothetical protein